MQHEAAVRSYPLFSVLGLEIEYMIVNQDSLEISPFTDRLFQTIQGSISNEVPRGEVALNNELALHVVELKTNGPKSDFLGIEQSFHKEVQALNQILQREGLALMPTATHPWTHVDAIALWPHGDKAIYNTYHKIFNCHGHGWSNLQSTHINLPFANEEEFVRLHQAIRVILPLIPALAASSPFCEAKATPQLCSRMIHYQNNQRLIPQITGSVIPEVIKSFDEYQDLILQPMFDAIAPYDPDKILQEEWLNSRGAIARFERNAIEIRVVDSQESPLGDMAVVTAVVEAVKQLMHRHDSFMTQPMHESELKKVMDIAVMDGMKADCDFKPYLNQLGLPVKGQKTATDVWEALINQASIPHRYGQALEKILAQGNLAQRMKASLNEKPSKTVLMPLYRQLMGCLQDNKMF